MRFRLSVLCAAALAAAPAAAQSPVHQHYLPSTARPSQARAVSLAPRLQNLGSHTFKVTTRSTRAQQFINQGLNLAYGFNHPEAGRAFAEAARLDPILRDGVLGTGPRARPEHQRGDGGGRRAQGVEPSSRRRCPSAKRE